PTDAIRRGQRRDAEQDLDLPRAADAIQPGSCPAAGGDRADPAPRDRPSPRDRRRPDPRPGGPGPGEPARRAAPARRGPGLRADYDARPAVLPSRSATTGTIRSTQSAYWAPDGWRPSSATRDRSPAARSDTSWMSTKAIPRAAASSRSTALTARIPAAFAAG